MEVEFEVIARPPGKDYGMRALTKAVLATAKTNQVVRIPMNGRAQGQFSAAFSNQARVRNLRVRTHRDGDYVWVWCEPREAKAEV